MPIHPGQCNMSKKLAAAHPLALRRVTAEDIFGKGRKGKGRLHVKYRDSKKADGHSGLSFPTGAPPCALPLFWAMASYRTAEETEALGWAEIARLVDIRPDGSWETTEFARDWFNKHPPSTPKNLTPVPPGARQALWGGKGD